MRETFENNIQKGTSGATSFFRNITLMVTLATTQILSATGPATTHKTPSRAESTTREKEEVFAFIQELYLNNRYNEAINRLSLYVKKFPDDAIAYKLLGECYQNTQKLEVALMHYDKALKLLPAGDLYTSTRGDIETNSSTVKKALMEKNDEIQSFEPTERTTPSKTQKRGKRS